MEDGAWGLTPTVLGLCSLAQTVCSVGLGGWIAPLHPRHSIVTPSAFRDLGPFVTFLLLPEADSPDQEVLGLMVTGVSCLQLAHIVLCVSGASGDLH